MSVKIEIVRSTNIATIKNLGYQTYLPHYHHLWYTNEGMEWYLHKCFNEAQLANDLADPAIGYYIIKVNGDEAGLMKLVRNKAPLGLNASKCLYLEKIYFLKQYTGQGFGQLAMKWVVEQAQSHQFESVWLMAMDSSHKAIAGYEKAGFTRMGTTRLDDVEFRHLKSDLRGMVIMVRKVELLTFVSASE